jgi:hypothetical protein
MENIKFMLIARGLNSAEWKNCGEYALPVLPRIGEHVVLKMLTDEPIEMYRVVGVFHATPHQGLTEVFAVYDGELGDVQNKLLLS